MGIEVQQVRGYCRFRVYLLNVDHREKSVVTAITTVDGYRNNVRPEGTATFDDAPAVAKYRRERRNVFARRAYRLGHDEQLEDRPSWIRASSLSRRPRVT